MGHRVFPRFRGYFCQFVQGAHGNKPERRAPLTCPSRGCGAVDLEHQFHQCRCRVEREMELFPAVVCNSELSGGAVEHSRDHGSTAAFVNIHCTEPR